MKKPLLRILSILAAANLLAIAGFVGWLLVSGRIDGDRLTRVREIFRDPIDSQRTAAAAPIGPSEAGTPEPTFAERKRVELPMSGFEEIVASGRIEDRAALASRGLAEEQRRLAADLAAREADLAARERQLVERQQAWRQSIADGLARETDEQFRKTVRLLESAPPRQAREWILELVQSGRTDLAVTFLDAMNAAKSAALLKAFRLEGDSKVATELLDRLRTLGLEGEAGGLRADAADPAQLQAESAGSRRGPGAAPASGAARGGADGVLGGSAGGSGGVVPNGAISLPGSSRPGARPGSGGAGTR